DSLRAHRPVGHRGVQTALGCALGVRTGPGAGLHGIGEVTERPDDPVRTDVGQPERPHPGGVDHPAPRLRQPQRDGGGGGVAAPSGGLVDHADLPVGIGDQRVHQGGLADPECPTKTLRSSASRPRSSVRSAPGCTATTGTPRGRYAAISSSGSARSALVRHSSGSSPASNPATRIRSIIPVRGGGSASAVTITSWVALATIGRSYGSSSSAVRRSTVSRSTTSTIRASVPSVPEVSPTIRTRSPTITPLRPSWRAL